MATVSLPQQPTKSNAGNDLFLVGAASFVAGVAGLQQANATPHSALVAGAILPVVIAFVGHNTKTIQIWTRLAVMALACAMSSFVTSTIMNQGTEPGASKTQTPKDAVASPPIDADVGSVEDSDDTPSPDGAAATDEVPGPGSSWRELTGVDWKASPGEEQYICASRRQTGDAHLGALRALSPAGMISMQVGVSDVSRPAGPCSASSDIGTLIYAGGIGTSDLYMPPGDYIPIRDGRYVVIKALIRNASDTPIANRSALLIKEQSQPSTEVSFQMVSTPESFEIATGGVVQQVRFNCRFAHPLNVFAWFPVLRFEGIHMKVTVPPGETAVLDQPYDVTAARFLLTTSVRFEELTVTCTYVNNTSAAIHEGTTSADEVCGLGMYVQSPPGSVPSCVAQ